jgi:hypothetical protein
MTRRFVMSLVAAVATLGMCTAIPAQHAAAAASAQRAAPTLGLMTGLFTHGAVGFGQVRPKEVYNGGDPTGMVTSITWSGWGNAQATGSGRSLWVGPNQPVAAGTEESARIVAFDLGTCNGHYMYAAVEWYFPQHKQTFDPNQFEDVCVGAYYPLEPEPYTDGTHGYTLNLTATTGALRGSISYGRRVVFNFHGSAAVNGSLTLVSNGPADTGRTFTGSWNAFTLTLKGCRSYLASAPSCAFLD